MIARGVHTSNSPKADSGAVFGGLGDANPKSLGVDGSTAFDAFLDPATRLGLGALADIAVNGFTALDKVRGAP